MATFESVFSDWTGSVDSFMRLTGTTFEDVFSDSTGAGTAGAMRIGAGISFLFSIFLTGAGGSAGSGTAFGFVLTGAGTKGTIGARTAFGLVLSLILISARISLKIGHSY